MSDEEATPDEPVSPLCRQLVADWIEDHVDPAGEDPSHLADELLGSVLALGGVEFRPLGENNGLRAELEGTQRKLRRSEEERAETERLLFSLTDLIKVVSGGTGIDGLVAERDELRKALATETCNGQSTEGAYHDAVTERDRLRDVARAANELLEEDRTSWSDYHTALDCALAAVRWASAEEGT